MIKKIKIEVYVNGMFYGMLRTNLWELGLSEEEIAQEVESRLPYVKGRNYTVRLV